MYLMWRCGGVAVWRSLSPALHPLLRRALTGLASLLRRALTGLAPLLRRALTGLPLRHSFRPRCGTYLPLVRTARRKMPFCGVLLTDFNRLSALPFGRNRF